MSYEQPETFNNKPKGACQCVVCVNILNSPTTTYLFLGFFLPAGFDIAYYLCWILLIILVGVKLIFI